MAEPTDHTPDTSVPPDAPPQSASEAAHTEGPPQFASETARTGDSVAAEALRAEEEALRAAAARPRMDLGMDLTTYEPPPLTEAQLLARTEDATVEYVARAGRNAGGITGQIVEPIFDVLQEARWAEPVRAQIERIHQLAGPFCRAGGVLTVEKFEELLTNPSHPAFNLLAHDAAGHTPLALVAGMQGARAAVQDSVGNFDRWVSAVRHQHRALAEAAEHGEELLASGAGRKALDYVARLGDAQNVVSPKGVLLHDNWPATFDSIVAEVRPELLTGSRSRDRYMETLINRAREELAAHFAEGSRARDIPVPREVTAAWLREVLTAGHQALDSVGQMLQGVKIDHVDTVLQTFPDRAIEGFNRAAEATLRPVAPAVQHSGALFGGFSSYGGWYSAGDGGAQAVKESAAAAEKAAPKAGSFAARFSRIPPAAKIVGGTAVVVAGGVLLGMMGKKGAQTAARTAAPATAAGPFVGQSEVQLGSAAPAADLGLATSAGPAVSG